MESIMKAHNILIPTDFSEESISVLKLAESFVNDFGSTIHLMHVVPVTKYFAESFAHIGYPYDLEKELYPKALNVAHNKLESLAEKYIKKENRGRMVSIIDRSPSSAIIQQANSGRYDIIIMATRGEHGSEFLRGSVTEKVIRRSEIPVFSMEKPFKAEDLNNIMVPLDMSDASFVALPVAVQIANTFGASLTLFHSVELYTADVEMIPLFPPFDDEDAIKGSLLNKVGEYLDRNKELGLKFVRDDEKGIYTFVGDLNGEKLSIKVRVKVTKGFSANRDIVDYANGNADMVIMSTHGHTGLARLFLGSTTEQVSQHVHVPLLTVRPDKQKESKK